MLTEQEALAIAQQALDESEEYPTIEFRFEKTFTEDDGWTFQFHVIYDNITEAMPFHRIFVDKETGEASPPKTRLLTEQEALANAEKIHIVGLHGTLRALREKGRDDIAIEYEKGYSWSLRDTYESETKWIFEYYKSLEGACIDPPLNYVYVDKRTGAVKVNG